MPRFHLEGQARVCSSLMFFFVDSIGSFFLPQLRGLFVPGRVLTVVVPVCFSHVSTSCRAAPKDSTAAAGGRVRDDHD